MLNLAQCPVPRISIKTAQSSLDCSKLSRLPGKTTIVGVLDFSTHQIETREITAGRIERGMSLVSPERVIVAPDGSLKKVPRSVASELMKAVNAVFCVYRHRRRNWVRVCVWFDYYEVPRTKGPSLVPPFGQNAR